MDAIVDVFRGKYGFLSNFYHSPIEYEGIVYPTVEHAYQAQKVTSRETRKEIALLSTPTDAKWFGSQVKLRPGWDGMKDDVMLELVRLKYYTHDNLASRLIETDGMTLYHANLHGDKYWGTDTSLNGENRLGEISMLIRDELKNMR